MPADTFRHEHDATAGVLVLSGDLEEGATVTLREMIREVTSGLQQDLRLDLTGVTFLPSAAIGVLATSQAGARRQGADLVFVAEDGSVAQRVLRVCGLDYVDPDAEQSEPQPS